MELAWHDEGVDDHALVAAVLDGDRDAFGWLVQRETASVHRACLRILGDPHDAEEIAQEAFVTAFRSLGTYRGEAPLRAWLLRIATRLAFRRAARRRPAVDLDALPERLLEEPRSDPASLALTRERHAAIRSAVAALPGTYREVVALRFFGELALGEISEVTGRPLNTVKTHLRRGLERLRPLVGEVAR